MLYVILGLFLFAGLLYPLTTSKMEHRCKDYFKECLDNDIYYPDAHYISQNDMDPDVIRDKEIMLEIGKKYMKSPEFEDEYLRRYNIGFELYKLENMDDLQDFLLKRHEKKMEDPVYREWYAKQRKADYNLLMSEAIVSVRNAKPSKEKFQRNYKKLVEKLDGKKK